MRAPPKQVDRFSRSGRSRKERTKERTENKGGNNGIGLANHRATTDRTVHLEVKDRNELAEADDDARRAEAAGDRSTERRTTPTLEGS